MGVMKTKHTKTTDCRLSDVWNIHAFARRELKDKMQQSRMKMLGAADWIDDTTTDTGLRCW